MVRLLFRLLAIIQSLAIREIPSHVINKLRSIGLNYFYYATFSDLKEWMISAGIRNVEIIDLTPILKRIW